MAGLPKCLKAKLDISNPSSSPHVRQRVTEVKAKDSLKQKKERKNRTKKARGTAKGKFGARKK